MSSPVANWYPDPTGRFELRYWDGARWTDHVSTRGAQTTDELNAGGSAQVATHQTGISPAGIETAFRPESGGAAPGMLARRREQRATRRAGRDEFDDIVLRAAAGDARAVAELPAAVSNARALYRGGQLEKKLWETMTIAVRSVIADDVLTAEEEQHLHRLGEIMGTPVQAIAQRHYALFEELVIAGINSGRFPHLQQPGMLLKRGEQAYASFDASLDA